MKRYVQLFILIIVLICIIGLVFSLKPSNNNEQNVAGNTIEQIQSNQIVLPQEEYRQKQEMIKGRIDFINSEVISTNSSYLEEETHAFNLEGYSCINATISAQTQFINYMDNTPLTINQIKVGDLFFYEGMVEVSTSSTKEIRVQAQQQKVTILKQTDFINLVNAQLQDKKEFVNLRVLLKTDHMQDLGVNYLYTQVKVKTQKNDELIYRMALEINKDTIIEHTESESITVVLKDKFETAKQSPYFGMVREASKISYE